MAVHLECRDNENLGELTSSRKPATAMSTTEKSGLESKVCPEDEAGKEEFHTIDLQDSNSSKLEVESANYEKPMSTHVSGGSQCASTSNGNVGSVEVVVIPAQSTGTSSDHTGSADHLQSERGMSKSCVTEDAGLYRCTSAFSTDSLADCCRICQQHADEPLLELGCHCRGELAKAHRSCIQQWFGNKGSNKCEICQQVAENVPAPPAQSAPHFWVWRLGINRGSRSYMQRRSTAARFHPLWAALLILIAGLLFDVLISIFLGASALPVNIIIGVLVVLGIGTAARLVVECWHERGLRRNIRRIETNLAHLQGDVMNMHGNALPNQPNFVVQSGVQSGARPATP